MADALHEAQVKSRRVPRFTRNQIAAQGRAKGWNKVFDRLKRLGLVREQSLAQVIEGYEKRHQSSSIRRIRAFGLRSGSD